MTGRADSAGDAAGGPEPRPLYDWRWARLAALCGALACLGWAPAARGQGRKPAPPPPGSVVLRELLILAPMTGGGRVPFAADPVSSTWLLRDRRPEPGATMTLQTPRGQATIAWKTIAAGPDGAFGARETANGLAYAEVRRDAAGVMILESRRVAWVRVGGARFAGDTYGSGNSRVPVAFAAGVNPVWLRMVRGGGSARFVPPQAALEPNLRDLTLPDLRRGAPLSQWAGVPVLNCTNAVLTGARLEVGDGQAIARATVDVPPLAPLAALQTPIRLRGVEGFAPAADAKTIEVPAALRWDGGEHRFTFKLRVREAEQAFKLTYVSPVDGSVQYYGVRAPREPASPPPGAASSERAPRALILSLHGAGVQANGQARAYSPKDWAAVVAPTNRRPFGFDWEDWGARDALDVLADARVQLGLRGGETYLTGHSMGGHGTWQLGVTYPDRWAAIGPSAGWGSFWEYGGGFEGQAPIDAPFAAACAASRTSKLLPNLAPLGVYVLHGTADKTVPVELARRQLSRLAGVVRDLDHHFQPGAGHWWDADKAAPGADCVDWEPMWRHFRRRRNVRRPSRVEFRSLDLGVSHTCHWVDLRAVQRRGELARLQAEHGRPNRFRFAADNLTRFRFSPDGLAPRGPLVVSVNGQTTRVDWDGGPLEAVHGEGVWSVAPPVRDHARRPERYGPLKRAFDRRFALVHGAGDAVLARARYDAGAWTYRGNGRALLVAAGDGIVEEQLAPGLRGRNLVLYGNATNNAVWAALAAAAEKAGRPWPLRVEAGLIQVGDRVWKGPGYAVLACVPHPGDRDTLIGLIGATGPEGLRLSHFQRVFVSGVGYPDVTVFDAAALAQGTRGVLLAGFWGPRWGLDGAALVAGR